MNFSILPGRILLGVFLLNVIGCVDQKREFVEEDFGSSTKMFCQKANFEGSPLGANTFLLHYNKEKEIGNIGQYVYLPSTDLKKVGVGYLYATGKATVTDGLIFLFLERLDSDESMNISIDRKTLVVRMGKYYMNCEVASEEFLAKKKKELLIAHEKYEETIEKESKL